MVRSKKSSVIILVLITLMMFMPFLPLMSNVNAAGNGIYNGSHNGVETFEWDSDLYTNWDRRIKIDLTEPNICDRVNEPIDLFLTFNPNTARIDKFRVSFYNGSSWVDVPTQVWNTTITGSFVDSATITFLTNISKGSTQTYYLYYSSQSAAVLPTYYNYVSVTNGTYNQDTYPSSPYGAYDYSYTIINAWNYTAKLSWAISSVLDFIINDNDLFGEYRDDIIPIEAGNILDFNNYWRGEIRDMPEGEASSTPDWRDVATLVKFTSGPVFTQISTTKYNGDYDRIRTTKVWTFYPTYWTLDIEVELNYYRSQNILVYGRSYHNGSATRFGDLEGSDNVINDATITIKYDTSYRSATINGYGGTEYMDRTIYTQPYWAAIYKANYFAYSNIPSPDSYDYINHYTYTDSTSTGIIYHYGAGGWSYSASPISSAHNWTVKLYYFPHGPQSSYGASTSDSFFAQMDYLKVINPIEVQIDSDRDNKNFNYMIFEVLDELGAPVYNATFKLFNQSSGTLIDTKLTDIYGKINFSKIIDSPTYNISVLYLIGGDLESVKDETLSSFSSNYTRTANYQIECNLRPLNVKILDQDTLLPLFNYSIWLNSSLNNLNFSQLSGETGWYNFTLKTNPSDLYTVNITDPEGGLITHNITSDVNITDTLNLIVLVGQPRFITSLTLMDLSYIDIPGTKTTGRNIDFISKYIEVYYGDQIDLTIMFKNISATPDIGIPDADESLWELKSGLSTIDSGNLQNMGSGNYSIILNTSDYTSYWGQYLTIKLSAYRTGGTKPPYVFITIYLKTWDTQLLSYSTGTTIIDNNIFSNYWRENITLALNYENILNQTTEYLDLDEADFNISIPGATYTYQIENHPLNNGSVLLELNLTSQGIGLYSGTITVDSSYYTTIQQGFSFRVDPVQINYDWNDPLSLFGVDNQTIRGVPGEAIPVDLYTSSLATPNFPELYLEDCSGYYTWDKETIDLNLTGGSDSLFNQTGNGHYNLLIPLLNLTGPELNIIPGYQYDISIVLNRENYSTLVIPLKLDLIPEWNAEVIKIATLVDGDPASSVSLGGEISVIYQYRCNLAPRIGNGLIGANVEILGSNAFTNGWPSDYWELTVMGNGQYMITYDTSFLNASDIGDSYPFVPTVTFSLNNYETSQSVNIAFSVTGAIGIPLEFIIIIGGVIGAAAPIGLYGYRYYQWARLPLVTKKLLKSIERIKKEGTFDIISPLTRDSTVRDEIQRLFAEAGLTSLLVGLAETPIKTGGEVASTTLVGEITKQIEESLPYIPTDEKMALINELVSLPKEEREFLIQSLIEQKQIEKPEDLSELRKAIEEIRPEPVEPVTPAPSEISVELDKLLDEGVITPEEKSVLEVELKGLSLEDQRKFLNKLRDRL